MGIAVYKKEYHASVFHWSLIKAMNREELE